MNYKLTYTFLTPSAEVTVFNGRVTKVVPYQYMHMFRGNRFANELAERIVSDSMLLQSCQELIKKLKEENEQLKEQLAKKKKPYEKFLPCICGHNRRRIIYQWGFMYECCHCGIRSYETGNRSALKKAWNNMITDLKEKEMEDGKRDS